MGMIASDFFTKYDRIEMVEAPFTVGEMMAMASVDVQERFASWTADNEDLTYLPAEVLFALLEDRAFFSWIRGLVDAGELVALSNVILACKSLHSSKMGLTENDVRENVLDFFERADEICANIDSVLTGTREWVSGLYLFSNGWVGFETERLVDTAWDETEEELVSQDPVPEPAASYLIDAEGDLIASPDIRYDVEMWMDFVDMFSAVHEEAAAGESNAEAKSHTRLQGTHKDGYIVFSDEVENAMRENKPVVIIESAATFAGMIYPGISDFAFKMRNAVREAGAVPAYVAILDGQIHVGLTDEEILFMEKKRGSLFKVSTRDIPVLLAQKQDGVMTIAAAIKTAALAGLPVACGSGIGGAQIGAERTMDISTDLESLARNPVMVVCSGTKPILDLNLTMEYLETAGVPVVGYGTDKMPEYMVRGSGFRLTYRMDSPEELAEIMRIKKQMGIDGGVLVVNPVPQEYELDPIRTKQAVEMAMNDVEKNHVMGKAITGYMMGRIREYLGEESMESQKAFLLNNAILASKLAKAIVEK